MSSYRLNRSIVATATRTGRLDLHGLSLTEVPADLFTYPDLIESLTSIDLSGNNLTVLTPEIARFKRLRCLTLDGNVLTQLPVELAMMPSLKTISLDSNPLHSEIMDAYQRSRTSGSNGRDATPVLAKLVDLEERAIQQEEHLLYGVQHNVDQINIESGASTPRSQSDSLGEEIARVDARFKQASLESHVFNHSSSNDHSSSSGQSKKHSTMSHTPSTVFTAAHDTFEAHSSKRILAPNQSSKSQNAPFGTDDQFIEQIKARRLPIADDHNEKENDFASLHGLGNTDQNRVVNAGKRMMRSESRPSPFGTIDGKFDAVSSNQQTMRHADEARKAIDELTYEPQPLKLAAGRSDSRGSGMADLMSHRAVNEPGHKQADHDHHGVRNFKQVPSDIFHTSQPTSPVQTQRQVQQVQHIQQRSTSPWATESDVPQAKAQSRYHHQTSNVFNSTEEVTRTGRARNQHKQENGIF